MSINMTQAFKFETDCLESYSKMLKNIIPILFDRESGEYTKLHIKTGPIDSVYWDDGSSYGDYWDNMTRVLEKPDGTATFLDERTYSGAVVLKEAKRFSSLDEATMEATAESEKNNESKPTRVLIALLLDYKSEFEKGDIGCRSHKMMHVKAMNLVKSFDRSEVENKLGDGYDDGFMRSDGSIDVAYRMHWEPSGGRNKLLLSATHAYYGK